jgi:catechol 2,3-dioxygenase-like lactoylglutathione lyase family enzyme
LTLIDISVRVGTNTSILIDTSCWEDAMSRVQLALNVTDLDRAVDFYSKLFGVEPAKRRPGYANFVVAEPPLKLVLLEGEGEGGTLNHLGVEVASPEEVRQAGSPLAGGGLATATETGVACCYAIQDKVWVYDPDAAPWEIYTVLADADTRQPQALPTAGPACVCGSPAASVS